MFDGLFIVDNIIKDEQSSEIFITYKRGVLLAFLIIISIFLIFIIIFGFVEKEKSDVALGISVTVIVLLVIAVVYFIFVHKVRDDHSAEEILARRKAKELKIEGLEFWLFVLLTFLSIFGVITTGIVKYFEGNQEWIDAISIFTLCLAAILFLYVTIHLIKGDKKMSLTKEEINRVKELENLIEQNPEMTEEQKTQFLDNDPTGEKEISRSQDLGLAQAAQSRLQVMQREARRKEAQAEEARRELDNYLKSFETAGDAESAAAKEAYMAEYEAGAADVGDIYAQLKDDEDGSTESAAAKGVDIYNENYLNSLQQAGKAQYIKNRLNQRELNIKSQKEVGDIYAQLKDDEDGSTEEEWTDDE